MAGLIVKVEKDAVASIAKNIIEILNESEKHRNPKVALAALSAFKNSVTPNTMVTNCVFNGCGAEEEPDKERGDDE